MLRPLEGSFSTWALALASWRGSFRRPGCQVLGVDPDARLAEFARHSGVEVEVSTFEAWEPAGRKFDAVVSGESWHWVDPVAGAAKAAEVLRPGGRLAVFWNTGQPRAGLDEAFAEVYRRVLPESLVARLGRRSIEAGAFSYVRQGG